MVLSLTHCSFNWIFFSPVSSVGVIQTDVSQQTDVEQLIGQLCVVGLVEVAAVHDAAAVGGLSISPLVPMQMRDCLSALLC